MTRIGLSFQYPVKQSCLRKPVVCRSHRRQIPHPRRGHCFAWRTPARVSPRSTFCKKCQHIVPVLLPGGIEALSRGLDLHRVGIRRVTGSIKGGVLAANLKRCSLSTLKRGQKIIVSQPCGVHTPHRRQISRSRRKYLFHRREVLSPGGTFGEKFRRVVPMLPPDSIEIK